MQNLIERTTNRNFIAKKLPKKKWLADTSRPFWLPASNFYVLAAAVAVAVFFIGWAILSEGAEEKPLISAGLLASIILAGAVVLREVILRSARYRLLLAQERLDYNIKTVQKQNPNLLKTDKLTLEKNREILQHIEKKSRAAESVGKLPEHHWQVFELCHDYLNRTERELEFAGIGSPRVAALRHSREKIQNLYRHHLLSWSSLESRAFIQEAKVCATISKKLENANKALNIIDSAIEFYPENQELLASAAAIKEFIATVKVSHWIEQAERFAFKGNYKRAVSHYRDALFYLARENVRNDEREIIAEKINLEIEKIRKLSSERENSSQNLQLNEEK